MYAVPGSGGTQLPVLGRCVGYGAFPVFISDDGLRAAAIKRHPAGARPRVYQRLRSNGEMMVWSMPTDTLS